MIWNVLAIYHPVQNSRYSMCTLLDDGNAPQNRNREDR
jgi:hypothetical protein